MTEIWKFPLRITDVQTVSMPHDAVVLTAQFQRGVLCLWAIVDSTIVLQPQQVWIIGTGQPCPDLFDKFHVATVQDGDLVWHIFMLHTL